MSEFPRRMMKWKCKQKKGNMAFEKERIWKAEGSHLRARALRTVFPVLRG
jgi:hypothetical protein